MVQVVSTCHQHDETVDRFINTFLKHWPNRYKLSIYYEIEPVNFDYGDRVTKNNVDDIPNMSEMRKALDTEQFRSGDFRFNAYAWAQKAIVIGHTGMMLSEPFLWLDSDTVTFKDIPQDFMEKVLPENIFMTILGRQKMTNPETRPYTETGFLAFDAGHDVANNFFAFYLNAWFTGAFKYLVWWTDCHVLDYTRHVIEAPTFDLTANLPQPCPADHVFVYSMLGQFMDHLKGGRKEVGYSPEHPLKWWRESDSS